MNVISLEHLILIYVADRDLADLLRRVLVTTTTRKDESGSGGIHNADQQFIKWDMLVRRHLQKTNKDKKYHKWRSSRNY
ncbi:hypothetical protein KEM48_003964 [Puccinia striiformis f. sp. tritici PST-130]|nr:hypothetical protein KEM48_003964 [Puccinia striiformis f. sp. tritici PST-130]